SVIGGGYFNQNDGMWCTIGGGFRNMIESARIYSTIPGGAENAATADYSFAAGFRAHAAHRGSLVWADSTGATLTSSDDDQVTFRAAGGVRFFSDTNASVGVQLPAGGTG